MPTTSSSPPGWARTLYPFGYTNSFDLDPRVDILQQCIDNADADSLLSVYYQMGHATLDHGSIENISWKDMSDCEYRFFGNVAPEHQRRGQRTHQGHVEFLVRTYGAHSYWDPRHRRWRSLHDHGTGSLVEGWREGGSYSYHPSRNHFYWVTDADLRSRLHKLATNPVSRMMMLSGRKAKARRK